MERDRLTAVPENQQQEFFMKVQNRRLCGLVPWRLVLLVMGGLVLLGRSAPLRADHLGGVDVAGIRTKLDNKEGYLRYDLDREKGRFGHEWSGWVDVRHPSLAGPKNTVLGYDRSDRFVKLQTTILKDNTGAVAEADRVNDFHFANKAFGYQAGVTVLETATRTVVSPAAGKPNTFDFPLTHGLGPQAGLPKEEQSIMANNNAGPPVIDIYYAKSLASGALAETFYPTFLGGAKDDGLFMANYNAATKANKANDTLGHELYHFLGDGKAIHQPIPGEPFTDKNKNGKFDPGEPFKDFGFDGKAGTGDFGEGDGKFQGADASHSFDERNIVYPFASAPKDIKEVGPTLAAGVGGKMQITSAQVEQIFKDADVTPFFPDKQRGDNPKAGHKVDWDFVTDHSQFASDGTTFGLENVGSGADFHNGLDRLYWKIGNTEASLHLAPDANNGGHDHTGLGEFGATPDFAGPFFRTADIFSIIARYSDGDIGADPLSLRNRALDYDLWFGDGTRIEPGILVNTFVEGWTLNSKADNYVARWVSPFDAKEIFIKAHPFNDKGHDGIAHIDAIIVSTHPVPEPSSFVLLGVGGLSLVGYVLRQRRKRLAAASSP
jgi:hypothetical protein